jgi:hypothetical protein
VPTVGECDIDESFTTDPNSMLFFAKVHDDFATAVPMPA